MMIINAIKYRSVHDELPKVWRFGPSAADYQSFQCFYGTPQELKAMRCAVLFALTGESQPGITEATIQISRPDLADVWIVERNAQRTRMIKNGAELDPTNVADTLLGAFLDLDEGLDVQAFDTFNLKFEQQVLIAVPLKDDHPGQRRVSSMVETNRTSLRRQLAAIFQQPMLDDDRIVHALLKSAKPLWEAYREILRQNRTLLAKAGSIAAPAQTELDKIEREVTIMESINAILQPLVDPANSPKVLKEKLNKTEEDLANLLKECQLPEVPHAASRDLPWEKLIHTLTRLVTYQNLVEASDKVLELLEQKCQTISHTYIETLESLICSDNQIIAELESCLATLSIQFEGSVPSKQTTLGDMVSRFIKPQQSPSHEDKRDRLENARMAVDYVLARLGELHGSIQSAREEGDSAIERTRERHEMFVAEHGKLSKLWQHLVAECKLPESMTIKQLLKLINHHGRLCGLQEERARLREVLQNRRSELQILEDSVVEWRRIAQSQKDNPLSNVALLVAEAQGIVRYLPKKKEAAARYRTHLEQQRSYTAIQHNIDTRKAEIEQKWSKFFSELQVPKIDIARSEWSEAFGIAGVFVAWDSIKNQVRKPGRGVEIFSDKFSDVPVCFHSCLAVETSNAHRLAVLQSVENHQTSNLQILLTADANLRDMLGNLGVSVSRAVIAEELRRKSSSPSPSRAQQILDLLNRGQS